MYHVIHKESGELLMLSHLDVNDMFIDELGRIIVCGAKNMELYWLLTVADDIVE
jgi:hypothetical protein